MTPRASFKTAVKLCALGATLPLFGLFLTVRTITRTDSCFASFSQLLSLLPGKVGIYIRAAFYRLACPDTSDDVSIGFLTLLSHRNTSIARGVYIGPQCNIGMCSIGENTLIGSGVHILSGSRQHGFEDVDIPIKEQTGHFEKIAIGSDNWIGNQSVIMAPTGPKAIVAAGSVVTSPVSAGDIFAGNPARRIRNRLNTQEPQLSLRRQSNELRDEPHL